MADIDRVNIVRSDRQTNKLSGGEIYGLFDKCSVDREIDFVLYVTVVVSFQRKDTVTMMVRIRLSL